LTAPLLVGDAAENGEVGMTEESKEGERPKRKRRRSKGPKKPKTEAVMISDEQAVEIINKLVRGIRKGIRDAVKGKKHLKVK